MGGGDGIIGIIYTPYKIPGPCTASRGVLSFLSPPGMGKFIKCVAWGRITSCKGGREYHGCGGRK